MVVLDFNTLSGTNPQLLTPKRYDDHPCHFYIEVPPPGREVAARFIVIIKEPLVVTAAVCFGLT